MAATYSSRDKALADNDPTAAGDAVSALLAAGLDERLMTLRAGIGRQLSEPLELDGTA